MNNNLQANKNAKIALKQHRMEIAADYGMHMDDVFNIIENAHNNGVLESHFKKLQNKKEIENSITSNLNKKM